MAPKTPKSSDPTVKAISIIAGLSLTALPISRGAKKYPSKRCTQTKKISTSIAITHPPCVSASKTATVPAKIVPSTGINSVMNVRTPINTAKGNWITNKPTPTIIPIRVQSKICPRIYPPTTRWSISIVELNCPRRRSGY